MTSADLHYKYDAPYVEQYRAPILAAAGATGIGAEIIAGIISRESGFGRLLSPKGPSGTGDYGHGRGLMQIDDRYHGEFISSGAWRDPSQNIMYGAKLLASYRNHALKAGVTPAEALRVSLAGYNRGMSGAIASWKKGQDPDSGTTGKNYSRDVLARSALFKKHFTQTPAQNKALLAVLPVSLAWLLGII